MPIKLLTYLLISKVQVPTFENCCVEILPFQSLDQLVLGFKILEELLLDVVHAVDLRAPFIELLGQNIDDAVAVDVARVLHDA